MCSSQTQGVICLLHKGKGSSRDEISNWRPISLTNFDYKLLAKVLARRLTPILETIIDNDQHAFIKGRNIANMLREIDDIIEMGKAEKSKSIILSIDYAKAFDSLSKNAILSALTYFGLGNDFIKWITIILNNRESCVRNAGYLSYLFKMERGVRQGCPISPLLFIITAELFARSIRNDPKIVGINIESSQNIKIRQFADDTTLFLRDLVDYREVLVKIKAFANFSGLHMNKKKSFAMFISDPLQKNTIKFGIRFVNKIKILGISFSNCGKVHEIKENYDDKIEQLKRLCSLWSKRNLSILGKITILKSFGLSLFIYTMQSVGIPESKLNEINQICFRFIWNKRFSDKRTIEKVKRKTLCLKKEKGGLNMINMVDIQHSYYFEWVRRLWGINEEKWKVIPKSLFKKIGGEYAFSSNVLSKDFKGLDILKNNFWEKVLWVWLEHRSNFYDTQNLTLNSPLFNNHLIKYKNETLFLPHCCQQSIVKVSDVINNGKIIGLDGFRSKFGTRPDTILAYNTIFNALYPHSETIIRIYSKNIPNKSLEIGSQDASTIDRKHFLDLINKTQSPSIEIFWTKKYEIEFDRALWLIPFKCSGETKLQILQWKILHNIYPTGILLQKFKIKDTDLCSFCNVTDTVEHFFFQCKAVSTVWKEIEKIILTKTDIRISLCPKTALFGLKNNNGNKNKIKTINKLILIGKLVISKYKYGKNINLITLLEKEIEFRKL